MEAENTEKTSRVEEMLKEDMLAREVFIALKAEQVVLFKRLTSSLTKLAIVVAVFTTLIFGFILFYLNRPTPAQAEMLNDIRTERKQLIKEKSLFNVEKELFYGIKDLKQVRDSLKKDSLKFDSLIKKY